MKKLAVGILAHVDAGKTTLSEAMLYTGGAVRKLGRVDKGDAFLDTYELEKKRGITIFSKQAILEWNGMQVTLLDTPGHVDFSAEMERTLQVLDYAVLVISGTDGVQGHTQTLWRLLARYKIPAFLFVNKMDLAGERKEAILEELTRKLDGNIVDFGEQGTEGFYENLAMCGEAALDQFLENGMIHRDDVTKMILTRQVFPCFFGSALKLDGIEAFMQGMEDYMSMPDYPSEFGAKVFKIARDNQGNRLTYMKITGGRLKVRELIGEEKVNQIRIYSGEKFEAVQEANAGTVCAVTGPSGTVPGKGIGIEEAGAMPVLEPVLTYRIQLPEEADAAVMLPKLAQLEEEEPQLHITWQEEAKEIHAQIMGEIQMEILKSLVRERFGINIEFGGRSIVYKETIQNTVEGVGHFEPLRHYAEVHLLMEPAEAGSGLSFSTECSEDVLDRNWQRLILTHLEEREHKGVLTGSAITDMKITLAAGRAHLKHTEGGDFRQSTYRAVRQGLMQAESVLLEPYYDFRLTVPAEMVGRALTDIQRMYGQFSPPETEGEMSIIVGSAPVSEMRDYPKEVRNYTRGQGDLSFVFQGYAPCHNTAEVLEEAGYDPQSDTENPTGSVFCSHGAGFYVPWNEVQDYMHIESQLRKRELQDEEKKPDRSYSGNNGALKSAGLSRQEEQELEEIFIRTYGKIERKNAPGPRRVISEKEKKEQKREEISEYLLVDGYNVIFAWEDLKELAKENIEAARNKLMDIMCNYQGYKKCTLILVFDAYKVEGSWLEIQKYHNIHVVYTKEAETADQYIEKVVHVIGRKYHVTVATSDGVEQVITVGQGASLISARELEEEVEIMKRELREQYLNRHGGGKNYLFDHMEEGLAEQMERIRLGEEKDFASEES